MSNVSFEEAQARLPQLIAQLQPSEEITLTDLAQPVAQLKKADRTSRPRCKPPQLARRNNCKRHDRTAHSRRRAEAQLKTGNMRLAFQHSLGDIMELNRSCREQRIKAWLVMLFGAAPTKSYWE